MRVYGQTFPTCHSIFVRPGNPWLRTFSIRGGGEKCYSPRKKRFEIVGRRQKVFIALRRYFVMLFADERSKHIILAKDSHPFLFFRNPRAARRGAQQPSRNDAQ
jgi:hypothetical protein